MIITTKLIIFIFGLFFLCKFTYSDLEKSEVDNKSILIFLIFGLAFALINKQLLSVIAMMLSLGVLGYVLWRKKSIGGADVKILFGIPAFFATTGFAETVVTTWFFLMFFLIVGVVYSVVAKKIFKKENIPFLPAITISYLLLVLWKIFL